MPTPALWRAVRELADAWRRTPVIDRFVRELPSNAAQCRHGLPATLQLLEASASSFLSNPLLLSTRLPIAMSVAPGVNEQQFRAEHGAWFDTAARAERAHRRTLAWLRARLPGYPTLPGPHLAPGSPLTTLEFTYRVVWAPGERSEQLQLCDVPTDIGGLLDADAAAIRSIGAATRTTAAALAATTEWAEFAIATGALDPTSRAELRAARTRAHAQLAPDAVDAYEFRLALPRAAYRDQVIRDEVESLTGAALTYARAFDVADRLLESACSSVFAQIVSYPMRKMAATDLEVSPGAPATVRFAVADLDPAQGLPRPGTVAWIEDPLVPDAVFITGFSMSLEQVGEVGFDLTADLLAGTSTAWRTR